MVVLARNHLPSSYDSASYAPSAGSSLRPRPLARRISPLRDNFDHAATTRDRSARLNRRRARPSCVPAPTRCVRRICRAERPFFSQE